MTQTSSAASLLHAALQDLHAGKRDAADRLPELAGKAGEALAAKIAVLALEAAAQADRIEAAGVATRGPKNLWMAGILDDAERDAKSHEAGLLRDIALVGALHKAKAAEIVSSETAIALARMTEVSALAEVAEANRAEEIAADARLRELLDLLVV